jgi:hypothetical protein
MHCGLSSNTLLNALGLAARLVARTSQTSAASRPCNNEECTMTSEVITNGCIKCYNNNSQYKLSLQSCKCK